jgi:hypothetical protein
VHFEEEKKFLSDEKVDEEVEGRMMVLELSLSLLIIADFDLLGKSSTSFFYLFSEIPSRIRRFWGKEE